MWLSSCATAAIPAGRASSWPIDDAAPQTTGAVPAPEQAKPAIRRPATAIVALTYGVHTPVEVSIFQLVRHVVETVVPVMVNGSQM